MQKIIVDAIAGMTFINDELKKRNISDNDIISVESVGNSIHIYYKVPENYKEIIGKILTLCRTCGRLFHEFKEFNCPKCNSENLFLISTEHTKDLMKKYM